MCAAQNGVDSEVTPQIRTRMLQHCDSLAEVYHLLEKRTIRQSAAATTNAVAHADASEPTAPA